MSATAEKTLPVGTQVVTRAAILGADGEPICTVGAVGVVVRTPDDATASYRVRFPEGREASIGRHDLVVRKHVAAEGRTAALSVSDEALYECVIYRCVIGSRAYGLNDEGSDTDRRGIYLPPAERHWSLAGVPEQLENHERQECYWELRKFLILALKANPNILECLYSPLVETATPLAQELLAMRSIFLSRLVYQTYNGYVMSQFKRLGQDLRTRGELNWKHAMHLLRLLLSGAGVLREGIVPLRVEEHRERLLAVRRGAVAWDEIDAWRLQLHKDLDAAYATTHLPELPDYERANGFLIRARRSAM
jgi:uncharacterized protein